MAYHADEAEFRRIEREVLDPFHKTLALFARGRAEARLGLLLAFDGLALPSALSMINGQEQNASTRQREKGFEDGLAQAMRWFTQPGEVPAVSSTLIPGLIDDAGNFLMHAADYSNLVDLHRLYGANMILAEVDQENKRIRFRYSSRDRAFDAAMGFISSIDRELVHLKDGGKLAEMHPQKPIGFDFVGGMVRLREPELLAASDPGFTLPLPPEIIANEADLEGFSMGELSSFWRALVHWSTHCLNIYVRSALSETSQESCMPTQVVAAGQFNNAIKTLSGLPLEKVARIIERLAFDYRTKLPCIFQQPLLVGDGTVAWSPNLVIHSRYDRNMLRLMARTPDLKHTADNLIGGRGRLMLNCFGKRLQRFGWSYKLNRHIQHGGRTGEVDLLAYARDEPDAVAVVEWKSILTADEVHEVRAATAELISAQDQVVDCVDMLRAMSAAEKHNLYPFVPWERISRYVPLVVTKDVEPNETYDQAKVPCLCVDSLARIFHVWC